jgi:putative redox protein
MHSRKLSFDNGRGHKLAAILDQPVDDAPIAWALFAHCFTCSKNYKAPTHVSRALAREGIATLRFDFTGLGDSEGDFADTSFSSNVDDLVAAAEYMQRALGAPTILIGHSLGGAAVIHAARRIESVRAVATIAAPSSTEHLADILSPARPELEAKGEAEVSIAGRSFTIGRQFLEELERVSMEEAIVDLGRPLLVFHSPVDTIVGIEHASTIFRTARHPKSFVSLDTADHLLSDAGDSLYVAGIIAGWARKYLDGTQEQRKKASTDDNHVVARTGAAGFRTEVLANGHGFTSDEPESVGGTNAGPSPYELLAASLAACTSMTLRMYADRKGWPLDAAEVRVDHRKVHCEDCANPDDRRSKIDRFTRSVRVEGDLDDAQRQRLLEIAERCPVHRTLHGDVRVDTSLAD